MLCGPLPLAVLVAAVHAQVAAPVPQGPATRGLYNWVHTTGDADASFPFYRDVFGIALARSPFAGAAAPDAPPPAIRPAARAGSDPLVWNLTNTRGSRFRTAFMEAANTPFGLELSEFFDVARNHRLANPWDPGTSRLIFHVRDLDGVMAKLKARNATIVTLGGLALDTPAGRSIVVRDPDGYLIEVVQASPAMSAAAATAGQIVATAIGLTVSQTSVALEFYRDLLGFDVGETRRATRSELQVNGLDDGELIRTRLAIPGSAVTVLLAEFRRVPRTAPAAVPFHWRIQDVGAPQFQLEVAHLDDLLERTKTGGYRFVSVDAQPIQRPFGRFVFVVDPDGVLVEFVEPAADR